MNALAIEFREIQKSFGLAFSLGPENAVLSAFRYALVLTAVAIAGLVIMHHSMPHTGNALADTMALLVVLVGFSTSCYVLTYRLRAGVQALRSLPLSVNRLAGLLPLIGVLPGVIAALLTLLGAR